MDIYPGCFDPQRLSDGPGAHAWNAVKLYGEWYLSDATWAAGSVGKDLSTVMTLSSVSGYFMVGVFLAGVFRHFFLFN